MPVTRRLILGMAAASLFSAVSLAQGGAGQPLSIIVPFAPGGPTDVSARVVANHMAMTLKRPVLIENVAGAGGATGANRARLAAPDGNTILVGNLGAMASNVALTRDLPYDPIRDFEPIGMINMAPMVVVAKPQLGITDLAAFRARLREKGETMSYGSGGQGSTSHLACLFLESELGARATHVPYRGTAPALNDVMNGVIDFLCDQATILVPQVQAGTVKALVVSSGKRLKALPDVPSAREVGVPDYIMSGWNGLFAPKGTPEPVLAAYREALKAALRDELVISRFEEVAADIPAPDLLTGAGLRAFVGAEITRWKQVVAKAGLTP
jgi:tripartite-type tricarboxylate transporter receptor subunit TctC